MVTTPPPPPPTSVRARAGSIPDQLSVGRRSSRREPWYKQRHPGTSVLALQRRENYFVAMRAAFESGHQLSGIPARRACLSHMLVVPSTYLCYARVLSHIFWTSFRSTVGARGGTRGTSKGIPGPLSLLSNGARITLWRCVRHSNLATSFPGFRPGGRPFPYA